MSSICLTIARQACQVSWDRKEWGVLTSRLAFIALLLSGLVACEKRMSCDLKGTWRVERLGCTEHPDARPAPVQATYTFDGSGGTTRWELPGCTVEADFEMEVDGTELLVRERAHRCEPTPPKAGESPTPCCSSSKVDVILAYRCQLGPDGADWMATLKSGGETGPWADRGAWRGCREGSLGMMRLVPVKSPPSK